MHQEEKPVFSDGKVLKLAEQYTRLPGEVLSLARELKCVFR